jgi:triacylglycerol esterase/lipase EstA (alpha/beta hydrolase family)
MKLYAASSDKANKTKHTAAECLCFIYITNSFAETGTKKVRSVGGKTGLDIVYKYIYLMNDCCESVCAGR